MQDKDPDYDPAADTDVSTEATEATESVEATEATEATESVEATAAAEPAAAQPATTSFNGTREQACNMIKSFSISWMQNPDEKTVHLLRCLPFLSLAAGVERVSVPYVAAMKLLHIISLKYNINLYELVSFFIMVDIISCMHVYSDGRRCTRCSTATSFYCGTHMKGKDEFDPVYYQSIVEKIAKL